MKKLSSSPTFLRLIANDRVMRLTSGVLEARQRFGQAADLAKEAWRVLVNGHELPAIDPAMRVDLELETEPLPKRARSNGANGADSIDVSLDSEPPPGATRSPEERRRAAEERLARQMAQRVAITKMGGRDVFDKCYKFMAADNARKMGVYPFFRPLDLNNGPVALLEGREVIMLGSNNYLGLTTHPRVREAAARAIEKYGTSMTGSRLVNGSMRLHNELEEKLAAYHGKEAGLVFTTGYQVNLAATSALLGNKRSVAVIDKEDHASIYDGVRLAQAAGARMVRYRHNDPESLDKCLAELDQSDGALVITDGVFSAQGEIARLDEITKVVKKHGARIMVDDAHALGVIGPGGRGTAAMFGIDGDVDLIGGTFSKSLASIGGWLVGERKVLDYIQHFAFSFLFAASAAPPSVAAAMAALEVMQEEPWRQEKLRENFTYMRTELKRMGFELGRTETAVIPIYIRDDLKTVMMWKMLLDDYGLYVNPFITPGVPPKQQVLRTSYMATHKRQHLDHALEAFEKVGKKFGVIS
ncbi:MAG TPA: aminotransferase class I/II-fold pyridoxal phosphate-dependent enzyme [Polyangiaceae bacterium]|nr:aminotransferase class I/II-fold pyridoxal phosphate-dependent enzyme [Polyangiaceae bacterium]